MKVSRTKFVSTFLVSSFAFQFISNSVLGTEVRLFPGNGDWFPGVGSSTGWKTSLTAVLYPVKNVLIRPRSFLAEDPDPAPPVLVLAVGLYWTTTSLALYYLLNELRLSRENHCY